MPEAWSPVFHAEGIVMSIAFTSYNFLGIELMKRALVEYKLYEGEWLGWRNEGTMKSLERVGFYQKT